MNSSCSWSQNLILVNFSLSFGTTLATVPSGTCGNQESHPHHEWLERRHSEKGTHLHSANLDYIPGIPYNFCEHFQE